VARAPRRAAAKGRPATPSKKFAKKAAGKK